MTSLFNLFRSASRSVSQARLGLDCFEERVVPASQVTAMFSGGVLTFTAQDAASPEDLVLTNGAIPGVINVAGSGTTTVKFGATTGSNLDFAGVKSINIVLKGGADSVNAQGIHIPGNLTINGGDGGNNLTLSNGTLIGGSVAITNGNGGLDIVTVNNTFIGKNLVVNQGAGADQSLVDVFGGSKIGGYMKTVGGAGNDSVFVDTSLIGTTLSISTGLGDDVVGLNGLTLGGSASMAFGNGINSVSISNSTFGGAVSMTGGTGSDTVTFQKVSVGSNLTISLGEANDTLSLNDTTVNGNTSINLGNGGNFFNIDTGGTGTVGSFLLGNLSVLGGTGVDDLRIGGDHPVYIGGMTTMALGAEAVNGDVVTIDDTTFQDAVKIDFGGGNAIDQLIIESANTTANIGTSFADKLSVFTGAGNDTVQLGKSGGGTVNQVLFGVTPLIDGGINMGDNDTLKRLNGLINGVSITGLTNFFKNFETVV